MRFIDIVDHSKGDGYRKHSSGHHYLPCPEVAIGRSAVRSYLEECCDLTELYDNFINDIYRAGERDPIVIAKSLIKFVGGIEPKYLFCPSTRSNNT